MSSMNTDNILAALRRAADEEGDTRSLVAIAAEFESNIARKSHCRNKVGSAKRNTRSIIDGKDVHQRSNPRPA